MENCGRPNAFNTNEPMAEWRRALFEHWIWIEKNLHIIRKPLWCERCLIFPAIFSRPSFPLQWRHTNKDARTHKPKLSSFIFNNYYFGLMLFNSSFALCATRFASISLQDAMAASFIGRNEKNAQNLRRNHNQTVRHTYPNAWEKIHIECDQINRKKYFRFRFHCDSLRFFPFFVEIQSQNFDSELFVSNVVVTKWDVSCWNLMSFSLLWWMSNGRLFSNRIRIHSNLIGNVK